MRAVAVAIGLVVVAARAATAAFHASVIDEVATSIGDDPTQQFVEITMVGPSQTQVTGSVLAAFDAAGVYRGDVLVLSHDVGPGTRWLMATPSLRQRQGITPDFEFPPGRLPLEDGMICWGAPGDVAPVDPASWDHGDFTRYVDCVAYGRFCGRAPGEVPVPATPADHSLVRVATGAFTDQAFRCSATLTPVSGANPAGVQIAGAPCATVFPGPCGTPLPGGAPLRTDCYGEWLVFGATGSAPVFTCPRGEPTCHAGQNGDCLMRAQFCFDDAGNPRYRGRCATAPLTRFALRGKERDKIDIGNAQTVLDAVARLGAATASRTVDVSSVAALTCTAPFDLAVPLIRKHGVRRGVRTLRAVTVARHGQDSDRLRLVCAP